MPAGELEACTDCGDPHSDRGPAPEHVVEPVARAGRPTDVEPDDLDGW